MTRREKRSAVEPILKIVLVDDHKLVRHLIRHYLESVVGFSVVAEADNGEDAIYCVKAHRPHICVMDVALKGLDGIEATKRIVTQCRNTHILAISASTRPDYIERMITAGAKGYISKDCEPNTLCDAVRAVAAGLTFFPTRNDSKKEKKLILSPREMQLLKLLCSGRTIKEIAESLDLQLTTLYTYKSRLLMKTGTFGDAELVKYAIKNGIDRIEY